MVGQLSGGAGAGLGRVVRGGRMVMEVGGTGAGWLGWGMLSVALALAKALTRAPASVLTRAPAPALARAPVRPRQALQGLPVA